MNRLNLLLCSFLYFTSVCGMKVKPENNKNELTEEEQIKQLVLMNKKIKNKVLDLKQQVDTYTNLFDDLKIKQGVFNTQTVKAVHKLAQENATTATKLKKLKTDHLIVRNWIVGAICFMFILKMWTIAQ